MYILSWLAECKREDKYERKNKFTPDKMMYLQLTQSFTLTLLIYWPHSLGPSGLARHNPSQVLLSLSDNIRTHTQES